MPENLDLETSLSDYVTEGGNDQYFSGFRLSWVLFPRCRSDLKIIFISSEFRVKGSAEQRRIKRNESRGKGGENDGHSHVMWL